MRLGLLQCDHVREEFRHLVGDYPELFRDLFDKYAPEITLQVYDVCHGELPASPDECEAYISTGSRYSVYDDVDWIHQLADFVRRLYENDQKFVGICFGHQMIAHALGGQVAKSDRGWGIGVKTVHVEREQSWMQPRIEQVNLLLSHQDQILQLPPDTTVLGGNEHCPYSMITVGDRFLGIQAHPEFTSSYAEALMLSRLERIGEATVSQARQTLSECTHEDVVVQWIKAFLREKRA